MGEPLKVLRQEKFATLVSSGITPFNAYIACGYSPKNAASGSSALTKNPQVAARIADLRTQMADQTVAAVVNDTVAMRNYVITELVDNVKRCKAVKKGNRFDSAGANRALELLGKSIGLFTDRTEHIEWDGDPRKLTAAQLEKFTAFWEEEAAKRGGEEEILKRIGPGVDLLPAVEEGQPEDPGPEEP